MGKLDMIIELLWDQASEMTLGVEGWKLPEAGTSLSFSGHGTPNYETTSLRT